MKKDEGGKNENFTASFYCNSTTEQIRKLFANLSDINDSVVFAVAMIYAEQTNSSTHKYTLGQSLV